MSFSIWEQRSFLQGYDVVIAGSGIVGLNSAWSIKKRSPHLKVLVVDRGALPQGASTRNAGVACFGTVSEIIEDLEHHSEDEVFGLVERRFKGLAKLLANLGREAIQYEGLGGYELYFENEQDAFNSGISRMEELNRKLKSITGKDSTYILSDNKIRNFGFKQVSHLIENTAEGQIDTGKMMFALMTKCLEAGVSFFNGTEIHSFHEVGNQVELICEKDIRIRTKKFLLATNGFSKALVPEIDVWPARAQVLITSEIPDLKVKGAFHFDKGFYYFRNVGNRLLFGGGRNLDFKTEETTEFGLTDLVQQKLEELLADVILPDAKYTIENRWSGIMAMGSKKAPIIKPLSENIFCAVRMSGMGVAIGSLVGEEAADLVLANILQKN